MGSTPTRRTLTNGVTMSCLALNASYEPLSVVPLKRAIRLVLQGKAEVLEADESKLVRAANHVMPRPAVIRLTRFVRVPQRFKRAVTNVFLFARDQYTCQYCGRHESELGAREALTRDHLHPLSKGGTNTWQNCVTACSKCNHRKANLTPEQAGLRLLREPGVPDMVWLKWSVRKLTPMQQKYITMFYGYDAVRSLRS